MRMFTKFSLVVAILSTGSVFGEEPVYFVDQNLKASVEADLQILDPTPSDMLQLTGFSSRHSNIRDLTGLEYATNLESLSLSFNEIESISPLADLSNLESVTLNDNQIRSISPLGGLEKLYDLDVHNNQIQSIYPLSGMTTLELLVLRGNQITDISPLSGLTSLTSLELEENQVSQISALSKMEDLGLLNLMDNDIRSIGPLTALTRLRGLNLKRNLNLNDEAFEHDFQTLIDKNPGLSLQYDPRPLPSVAPKASQGTYEDRVRVTWSRVNNGPLYTNFYRVYRARSGSVSGPKTEVSAWQRDNVFEDTGVNAGTEYEYWISVAVSDLGENAILDEASARGWASRAVVVAQPVLTLSSSAGGEVISAYDASSARLGDVVAIRAEPMDAD